MLKEFLQLRVTVPLLKSSNFRDILSKLFSRVNLLSIVEFCHYNSPTNLKELLGFASSVLVFIYDLRLITERNA